MKVLFVVCRKTSPENNWEPFRGFASYERAESVIEALFETTESPNFYKIEKVWTNDV